MKYKHIDDRHFRYLHCVYEITTEWNRLTFLTRPVGEHSDLHPLCEGLLWSQAEGYGEVGSYVRFAVTYNTQHPDVYLTFCLKKQQNVKYSSALSLRISSSVHVSPGSPALRMAFLLLLLISATWMLGLMAVNSNVMTFHYLFALFSCLQVTQCLRSNLLRPLHRESAHIFCYWNTRS